MGARIAVDNNTISASRSRLHALQADLSDCIDLLPTVSVLAAMAEVAAVKSGLQRMGINVIEEEDRIFITGAKPRGTVIDSKGDHRIAMAFSIPGLVAGDTVIEGAECVAKTFPAYWDVLTSLGAKVVLDG